MPRYASAKTLGLTCGFLVLSISHVSQAVMVTSTWTGNNGDPWNDAVHWTNSPPVAEFPDNTPGTNTFDVNVGIGRPLLSTTVEINNLQLGNLSPTGGIVTGSGTLTAKLGTTIGTLGGFDGSGTFNAENTITVDGGTFTIDGWTVNAMSDVFQHGPRLACRDAISVLLQQAYANTRVDGVSPVVEPEVALGPLPLVWLGEVPGVTRMTE